MWDWKHRPVSVLSIVSKILERAVYTQLEGYLVKKNLLWIQRQLLNNHLFTYLTDYIKTQTYKGLYTGMIIGSSKSFWYGCPCNFGEKKLKAMSVKSVDWFTSYLSNRSQIVHVNNTQSDPSFVTCGVQQGSILGPLLFLCYVKETEIHISSESKVLLYADDSAILYSHKILR